MEETIIRMAAPTLAGIKTGSLFPYYYTSREELGKEMGRLNRLLIPRGLRLVLLRLTERSALLYLFRPSELEKDLLDSTACEILHRAGYPCSGCGACLRHLLKRFHCGEEFPHEIGLFLSYPPEDVKGFLTDRDNYKAICLWKVYDDEKRARHLCARYKNAQNVTAGCGGKGADWSSWPWLRKKYLERKKDHESSSCLLERYGKHGRHGGSGIGGNAEHGRTGGPA